nr:hypothetical protein [Tanacetum cinerariifolium]
KVKSSYEESLGEDASKQERRIDALYQDEYITLVNVQGDAEMFDVDDLGGEEAFVIEQEVVSTAATTVTTEELTLAQALKALNTSKPKVKGIVIHEQENPGKSTTTTTISKQQSQDKGKRIMIEDPVKPKKKDQIRLDEEAAKRLQAEFDEEERLARGKAQKEQEANIALIETWDDIHANIDADNNIYDYEILQAQEQEELSNAEKATLFQQLLEKQRKHFAAKRAKEKRNKPPTQAQKKKIICNYLKNMERYTLKQLKLKEFDEIQEMFDKAFRRIVDWKIYKEGKKSYYQIVRADRKTQMYMSVTPPHLGGGRILNIRGRYFIDQ